MNYRVRPAARRDITRYWRIIKADNPDAAARFLDDVEKAMEQIAKHPALLGHEMGFRRHAGVCSFRLAPPFDRYLIFFRLHPRHVEFKRQLHGTRNLPRLFPRRS
jgi:plasmid stabilization system protein ParE